jgi:Fungal specific transcription factor domain
MGYVQVSPDQLRPWCIGVHADSCVRVCGVCLRRKDKGVSCKYSNEKEASPAARGWDHGAGILQHSKSPSIHSQQTSPQFRHANGQLSSLHPTETRESQGYGANQNFGNLLGGAATGEENSRTLQDSESARHSNVNTRSGELEDTSKGIDSMTGVIGEQSHGHGFFGSSSAGSFMTQIKSAIDAKVGLASRRPSISGTAKAPLFTTSNATHPDGARSGSVEYVLPPRKTADNLLGVYWELVYPLYPFVDRHLFQDAYQSIWSGSESVTDERMFMCTLNVVFALACQLSEAIKPENREQSAKVYFKRAQELLQLDFWDTGSTELIQCLLLMGQYLQSTNTPHQCWMVVGHAVRMAQGLGFHLPESSFELRSSRERELSRVIWHGCVLMDRYVLLPIYSNT